MTPSSMRLTPPKTAESSCSEVEATSKFSLKCCAKSSRTNIVQPCPPCTSGMQSLMPMPAYWAPAGWQSYIGLMMPARSRATSLTSAVCGAAPLGGSHIVVIIFS